MNPYTRIIDLTIGEFLAEVGKIIPPPLPPTMSEQSNANQYVYGITGIAEFLGVCPSTVCKYRKDGWIEPAISQLGRTIIADKEHLIQLFQKNALKHS